MRAIDLTNVSERYRIKFIEQGKVSWEEILALNNLSFGIEKGEIMGVIGENGAGKTTLLKLICGMLIPDSGKIEVNGKVSVIMELGAGFNPEFTGKENVLLNAKMYGLNDNVLDREVRKIIEFADLGRFIDAPVKYYSQGMYMRLAFALAIFIDPDVLLIDDIISVGDEEARQKSIKKIFELKHSGKTVVLVSHEMDMVNKLCDRAILLEKGCIIEQGNPQKVTQRYLETVGDKKAIAVLKQDGLRAVFNNGKLFLSYNGSFLTNKEGACSVFFLP
ncbi:MAG: ABC transporter ATP-binding protein, partial [Candidatus Omnitrophota bacterium]